MNVLIFFACFILAVVIGTKLKINFGFIAIIFGFLITWLYLKKPSSFYVSLFPVTLFWNYGMPIIFYGFASANGTLNLLGRKVVYKFRNATKLLPFAIALVAIIVAATGASTNNTFIVAPLAWSIAVPAGLNPLLVVACLWCGSFIGGFLPWTSMGALHSGLMLQNLGVDLVWRMAIYLIVMGLVIVVIMYIVCKGWKVSENLDKNIFEKPGSFNAQQKCTLAVIFALIALLLIPSILNQFIGGPVWKWMSKNLTIPITCSMGIAVLCLLHAGDLKEIFAKNVNWNILWIIVFMSQYCGLASQMGVNTTLASWLQVLPAFCIAPCLCLIGAALSFCVSASSVMALLYAMVPALAAAANVSYAAMTIPFIIGISVTSISPISTGGAASQIGAPREIVDKLFTKQLLLAVILALVSTLLAFTGFYAIGA